MALNRDLNLRNQPYSGIACACSEICGDILALQRNHPDRYKEACESIRQATGTELPLLIQVVPALAELFDSDVISNKYDAKVGSSSSSQLTKSSSSSSSVSKEKFHFALIRFVRIICQQFAPFVMVLDDLQWADSASFDLVEVLTSDQQNS